MLIKCKECGKEISDKAEKCPNCGYKTKLQSINIQKSNSTRTGTILAIIGASLLIAYAIIIILALIIPNTTTPKENTMNADITFNVTIVEETETNTTIVTNYIILMGIVSISIVTLGILYLKNIIASKYMNLYGFLMLILSITLSVIMIVTFNCCLIFLLISPILCFVGSILIIIGNVKERENEVIPNN